MPNLGEDGVSDRTALILYGSETGTAQDVADELGRVAERLHFQTHVTELNSVRIETLSEYTVVLIAISTTGQGDLPANARSLWRSLLRKKLRATCLERVVFAIFGLGDSSYPKFNWAARKLHKRILQLGANSIHPIGEADEQHPEGTDSSLLPWLVGLRQQLLDTYPLPDGVLPVQDGVLLSPKWVLTLATEPAQINGNGTAETALGQGSSPTLSDVHQLPPSDRLPIAGSVTVTLDRNERCTPMKHWQDVRQLSFSASTSIDYGPGDVMTIYPKNFPEDVDHFIDLMEWQSVADAPVRFKRNNATAHPSNYPPPPIQSLIACPVTLRKLLIHHLDITAIPRRSFFSLIAHFTNDETQKERLLEFTNSEYLDELYDYTTRPRRSILEVLQEFTTVKIPWHLIASVLPCLRGRQFSIASGGGLKQSQADANTASRSKIELLVAIVKYRTVIKKIRQGVCTRYLAALPTGTDLTVTLSRGGLNVSKSEASRPVVMIAPGTGVAPMRSMLWERLAWQETAHQNNGQAHTDKAIRVGKSVLFFGCRNREADYFYHDEWEDLKSKMDLEVFTATSRDQRQKIYVQDLVRQQAKLLHRLLQENAGIVYICGSSGKMPSAVREALIEVFQQQSHVDRGAAEAYLATMEKEGRYKQETW